LRSQQNQTPPGSRRHRADIEGGPLLQTADKQAFQEKAFERAHGDTEGAPLKKNARRMNRRYRLKEALSSLHAPRDAKGEGP